MGSDGRVMIFSRVKTYALGIFALLLGGMAVALKAAGLRNKKLEIEADYYKGRSDVLKETLEADNELEGQAHSHRAEAANSDRIAGNPNILWDDDPDKD